MDTQEKHSKSHKRKQKHEKSPFKEKNSLQVDDYLFLCWAHSFRLKNYTLLEGTLSWLASAPSLTAFFRHKDMRPFRIHAWASLLHEGALLEK